MISSENVLERLSQRLPHLRHVLSQPHQPVLRLQLDSIDLVELLCVVEDEFGVRVSDDDLQLAGTVGGLAELIETRQTESRVTA